MPYSADEILEQHLKEENWDAAEKLAKKELEKIPSDEWIAHW